MIIDIKEVERHKDHGRGDDSGPDDPDCPCRGTDQEVDCALDGCGFCSACICEDGKRYGDCPEHGYPV